MELFRILRIFLILGISRGKAAPYNRYGAWLGRRERIFSNMTSSITCSFPPWHTRRQLRPRPKRPQQPQKQEQKANKANIWHQRARTEVSPRDEPWPHGERPRGPTTLPAGTPLTSSATLATALAAQKYLNGVWRRKTPLEILRCRIALSTSRDVAS